MKITKEQIFAAADALVAEGKTPKVSAVREILGAGSFTTINAAMQEWRDGQKPKEAPEKEVAPQAIADRLAALGNEVWAVAVKAANESLENDRAELAAVKVEMDEELHQTAEYADKVSDEVDKLREEVGDLTFSLETERIAHEGTRNLLQGETDAVIALKAELVAERRHFEDVRQDNKDLKELLGQREAEHDRSVESEKNLSGEVVRLNGLVASLEDKAEMLRESVRSHKEDKEQAVKDGQAAQIEAAKLKGEVESLTKQITQQAEMFKQLTASLKPAAAPKQTKAKGEKADETAKVEQK